MGTLVRYAVAAAVLAMAAVHLFEGRVEAAATSGPASAIVGDVTTIPFGWVDFCRRYRGECGGPRLAPQDVALTDAALDTIARVNRAVNADVEPQDDLDHWGVADQWDLPTDGRGDCEDYALLKRKLLADAGLPRQALLLTVVRDRKGEGHAVLTVKTSRGDYVLDNLSNDVKLWTETGYRFVKRQSQEDPDVWVSLGDPGPAPLYTAR